MLWILAFVLIAIVGLLLIPVGLEFHLKRTAGWDAQLRLHWLFGLVWIPLAPANRSSKQGPRPNRKKAAGLAGKPRRIPKRIARVLFESQFHRNVFGMLRGLVRALRVRHLRLWLRWGSPDPAETGMLWAAVGPVVALLPGSAGSAVDIAPDFEGECVLVDTEGTVSVVPARVLWIAARFVLSVLFLRALWRP